MHYTLGISLYLIKIIIRILKNNINLLILLKID